MRDHSATRRLRARLFPGLILIIAIGGTTLAWAQSAALPASAMAATDPEASAVRLLVGRSTVIDVGSPIARVSLTSADVADALVTSPNQLLLNGKEPGTISMFVWDRGGALRRFEVTVQRDLTRLAEQMKQLFPNESIEVQGNGKNIVLSGSVSSKEAIERAVNVAAGFVDKREEVVTLLQLQAGAPSNQVLLRVRFAEVSRSALSEIGASLFTGPNGYKNYVARTTTEQFGPALPNFDNSDPTQEKLVFSDFLNLFLFDQKNQIGTVIKALQSRGQFQTLAEPNLVAESGKEASFLAGGEFPVPIAQGSGNTMAISVMFKEFGIRLNFTPIVNGDRIHLKVRPEVSTLDFGNAVVLNGFRIPALQTRRTETELELQDKQTFAIAGLLNNKVANTMQKIPGLGDIPILGLLFKSKAVQKDQTELVVMITPEILPNNSRGVTPNLPRTPEQFLPPLTQQKSVAPQAPAFVDQQPKAAPAVAASQGPITPLSPAEAAAIVSNLVPSGPRLQNTDANANATGATPSAVPSTSGTAVAPVLSNTTSNSPAAASATAAPAIVATPEPAPADAAVEDPSAAVTRPLTDEETARIEQARRAEDLARQAASQSTSKTAASKSSSTSTSKSKVTAEKPEAKKTDTKKTETKKK